MREPVNPDLNMGGHYDHSDHDLLIRVDTKMDLMKTSLDEFRGTMSTAVNELWDKKANKADVGATVKLHILQAGLHGDGTVIKAQNERLTRIERTVWGINGAVLVIQLLLHYGKLW